MVVKIDVGVHHNGYIGDNAVTVSIGNKHDELVAASKAALDAVAKILRPGCTQNEVGEMVNKTITQRGFLPIRNLSGHGLGRFKIHTSPSMPNFPTGEKYSLVPNPSCCSRTIRNRWKSRTHLQYTEFYIIHTRTNKINKIAIRTRNTRAYQNIRRITIHDKMAHKKARK